MGRHLWLTQKVQSQLHLVPIKLNREIKISCSCAQLCMQSVSKPFNTVYLKDYTAQVYRPLGEGFSIHTATAQFQCNLLGRSTVMAQAPSSNSGQRRATGAMCTSAPSCSLVWPDTDMDEAGAEVPDKVFHSSSHVYLI